MVCFDPIWLLLLDVNDNEFIVAIGCTIISSLGKTS